MSRISFLARHPRRSLTALATLVAAGAVVVGSGAVFSTQTANPNNTFASGILKQDNSNSGAAILTASQLIPGTATHNQQAGVVDITNSGTVAGAFTLTESNLVDQDSADGAAGNTTPRTGANKLSGQLQLKIWDCGSPSAPSCPADGDTASTLYNGALGAFPAAGVSLGSFAATAAHRYRFLVYLPDNSTTGLGTLSYTSVGGSGDNAFSGAFTSAKFNWTSVTQ